MTPLRDTGTIGKDALLDRVLEEVEAGGAEDEPGGEQLRHQAPDLVRVDDAALDTEQHVGGRALEGVVGVNDDWFSRRAPRYSAVPRSCNVDRSAYARWRAGTYVSMR